MIIDEVTDAHRRDRTVSADALAFRAIAFSAKKLKDHARAGFDEAVRADPECVLARLGRADFWLDDGQTDLALRDLDAAIRSEPGNPQSWLKRAVLHASRRDWAHANADFSEAPALVPDPRTHRRRATTYAQLGHYDFAATDCVRLLTRQPELKRDSEFCRFLGNVFAELGQQPLAVSSFKAAIDADSRNVGACYEQFIAAGSLHGPAESADRLERVLARFVRPDDPQVARRIAWVAALNPEVAGDAVAGSRSPGLPPRANPNPTSRCALSAPPSTAPAPPAPPSPRSNKP